MYVAQLVLFLILHHHAHTVYSGQLWAHFTHWQHWAIAHGFVYQR